MSVTQFCVVVVLFSINVGVPIQRIVGSAPLSATSRHSHMCGAASLRLKASAISLVIFCAHHTICNPIIEMDMPVNVPVDDPNADTEWFVSILFLPSMP